MKAAAETTGSRQTRRPACWRRTPASRLLANQGKVTEALASLEGLREKYPGRSDILCNMAWVYKKSGDISAARMNYKRGHELGGTDRDAYWHWSEMEAANEERRIGRGWQLGASVSSATNKGCLFRQAYAIHRQAKELVFLTVNEKLESNALGRPCRYSAKPATFGAPKIAIFHSEIRYFAASCVNLEILDDGPALADTSRSGSKSSRETL